MTTWHYRMLPYPLLAPWTEDYTNSSFGVDVPEAVLNNGRQVKIDLEFRLHSGSLQGLIEDRKATFAVEISCPRTFSRNTHVVSESEELNLDAGDYDEEIVITPYVASLQKLEEFKTQEHASEWRDYRPEGFTVPAAGILAVGNSTRIILKDSAVTSVMDLIANPSVPDGSFLIQLDDERIKIHVPTQEKARIEAVRVRRGSSLEFVALFPGLYLHAVAEAIRNISDYEHTRWASATRNALERCGHEGVDAELLQNDALRYAQQILEQPLGKLLTAAMSTNEEY